MVVDAPITTWVWEFGGDTITNYTNESVTQELIAPGQYEATLTVYDTNGCYDI